MKDKKKRVYIKMINFVFHNKRPYSLSLSLFLRGTKIDIPYFSSSYLPDESSKHHKKDISR